MTYKLTSVDSTEELILNKDWPNSDEPATGWRRFRINYRNEQGFSNIEGTIYIPPCQDPFPIVDQITTMLNAFAVEEYETPDE